MPFRHICATFLLLFNASLAISAHATSSTEQKTNDATAVSELKAQFEPIPDSHIILNTETYGVAEGLSQNAVTSMAQDKYGYLWIGTVNGLNRFDGSKFKSYFKDSDSGLPNSFIRSLLIDGDNFYVGTDRGLALYDIHSDSFITIYDEQINGAPVWAMTKSDKGIFIGTEKNIFKISENQLISIFDSKKEIFIKTIVATDKSLYFKSFDGILFKINSGSTTIIEKNVYDIEKVNDEKILFSTNKGIYSLGENKIKLYDTPAEKLFVKNNDMYTLSGNEILNISQKKSIGKIKQTNINALSIYPINNDIIIGTYQNGLIRIGAESNIISTIDISNENVWDISKSKENYIISTNNKKIDTFNINFSKTKGIKTESEGYKYTSYIGNKLYYGSNSGLFLSFNNSNIRILPDTISSLSLSWDKKSLLVGTAKGILYRYTPEKKLDKIKIPSNSPIFYAIEDSNNNIYIASQDGIFTSKNSKLELLSDKMTYSICINTEAIFFGTSNSILRYDVKKNKLTTKHSSNESIFSLFCTNNYLIAASTGKIFFLELNNNKTFNFSTKYGSQIEYNSKIQKITENNLIIGGTNGVSQLIISKLKTQINKNKNIKTLITELLVQNVPIKNNNIYYKNNILDTKKITLKYSDYPFTIKFDSPFHLSKFKYRMLGLSDEWVTSSDSNSATYTNLSSGEYVFQVLSEDPLNGKNGPKKSLKIIITPPWWLSLEAKAAYILLCLLIIILFIRSIIRRREIQKLITKSEERLKLSLWGSGDEIWDWDLETGKIYRSNVWGTLDFPVVGQRVDSVGQSSNIHPMDRNRVKQLLEEHLQNKSEHFEVSYRVKSKDKKWIWILDRAKVVERSHDNKPLRMTGTIKNINQFKQTEEQLTLFERAIENISEGMFILDHSFRFIQVNQACCDITQTSRDHFIGQLLKFKQYPDNFSHQVMHMLRNHGRWTNEIDSLRGDGTPFQMEMSIDAIFDERDQTNHYVAVFTDVTYKKQQQIELRKLTTCDNLTGLPNRSFLQVTINNLVKRQVPHVLMILDLDNFKKINDSLGHNVGDQLLKIIANRINLALPSGANLYRLGGDEFAILIESQLDISSAATLANSVIGTLDAPLEIENQQLVVGVSVGIVFYPEDETDEQAILRKADIAMYAAKTAGGNRYHFYSDSLNDNALRQLDVENQIREGLRHNYFEVYYQPKVSLKTNKIIGMEALVRLIHPENGMVSPAEFIPLAEETGLIVDIGEVVLKKACAATQQWRETHGFEGRVAVNLSSRQFALPDLEQRIKTILFNTGLPAASLEIEITEGTVIEHPEKAIRVMQKLTQMGIHLALDDFGTGYSSLTYLKRFPIHSLKIDKAFIDDIDKSDRDLKMVDSIITIAHNMGLTVVAEGVEEQSQLSVLRALNCEEIQGYIFSKPVPREDFGKLIMQ